MFRMGDGKRCGNPAVLITASAQAAAATIAAPAPRNSVAGGQRKLRFRSGCSTWRQDRTASAKERTIKAAVSAAVGARNSAARANTYTGQCHR